MRKRTCSSRDADSSLIVDLRDAETFATTERLPCAVNIPRSTFGAILPQPPQPLCNHNVCNTENNTENGANQWMVRWDGTSLQQWNTQLDLPPGWIGENSFWFGGDANAAVAANGGIELAVKYPDLEEEEEEGKDGEARESEFLKLTCGCGTSK